MVQTGGAVVSGSSGEAQVGGLGTKEDNLQ